MDLERARRFTRPGRTRVLLAAVLSLGLLVAACGSDDSDGASDDSDVDVDAVLGEPNEASGQPVVVGMISASETDNPLSEQFQQAEAGMQIAIDYANEYLGGVGGRPLEAFICQGGETPAGSQDCANQMVNEDVAAVVMPFTANGASMVPIITDAGIPFVILAGTSQEELTTPGAFALTAGFPGTLAAYAEHAAANDVEKFSILATDGPGVIEAVEGLGGLVFGNAGVEFEPTPVPVGTADMTPQVQAAVEGGADALGMVGDLTFCTSFLQAYQTLALDLPRYLIATCIDPTVIDTYGQVIDGSIGSGLTGAGSSENEDRQIYTAITEKYGEGENIDPDPAISTGYASGVVPLLSFVNAMQNNFTGDPTAAAVLQQFQTATDTPLFLGDNTTFTCNGTAISLLPNICSSITAVGTYNADGVLENAEQVDVAPLFG